MKLKISVDNYGGWMDISVQPLFTMIIEEGTREDFKHCALATLSTGDYADGLGAPLWLKQRMENLRNLPPPTLEEVRAQFKASANWQDNWREALPDRYS